MPIVTEEFLDRIRSNDSDLQEILFPGRGIDDEDIIKIVDSIINYKNHHIRSLYLPDNDIGDKGCKSLSSLRSIDILDISGNNISDIGAIFLSKLSSLQTLDIANNEKVTARGFAALLKSLNVIQLNVSGSTMTMQEFKDALKENSREIECIFGDASESDELIDYTPKHQPGFFAQKENQSPKQSIKAELDKLNKDITAAYEKIPTEDRDEFIKQLSGKLIDLKQPGGEIENPSLADEWSVSSW